ncbi:MAG TPA: biotin/lipoyl-binding protein, partial [Planctomycetota bacterium]|nr:biotin/lipoyl-binding protein [Planctomycetota bacterium]
MKMSFLKADTIKEPVKPVQDANRRHKVRGYPIFRSLLIAIACASPITLLYLWWSSRQIHAYGVVTGHVGTLSAPARSRIDAVYVEVGDLVRAGDTLYVISSDEARVELDGARHELAREQARLTGPDGDAGTADGARQAEELSAEQVRLEERAASAGRRLDEVRRLVALQAAVAGDERQALAAYRDAQLTVDVNRLALERARRTADERLVQARSRIAELEMRIARLAVLAGPTEIRAESDGVV